MTLTLRERERAAYMEGDTEKAELLARLEDQQKKINTLRGDPSYDYSEEEKHYV